MNMRTGQGALLVGLVLLGGCAGAPAQPWWSAANVAPAPRRHSAGAIFATNAVRSLFADVRARRVGDVITVLINEQAVASKQASAKVDRQGSVDNSATALFNSVSPGSFNLKAGAATKFSGGGQAAQKNSFTTTLTALVTHVLPGGNLVIAGRKKVVLDQGPEIIRLSGIVRPASIGPNNTVYSSEIADETIRYTGSGAMQDAQRMGWLQRLLIMIWPF